MVIRLKIIPHKKIFCSYFNIKGIIVNLRIIFVFYTKIIMWMLKAYSEQTLDKNYKFFTLYIIYPLNIPFEKN